MIKFSVIYFNTNDEFIESIDIYDTLENAIEGVSDDIYDSISESDAEEIISEFKKDHSIHFSGYHIFIKKSNYRG